MFKKEKSELARTQKLLGLSNISLSLNSYDDIFSGFDPRPYSQRALSDDFLAESKRASRDKELDGVELIFLIPQAKRNLQYETTIKKRLKAHFIKHHNLLHGELRSIQKKGYSLIFFGILTMVGATFLYSLSQKTFFINLLVILFEPAGWFLFWTGLDQFFYSLKQKKVEWEFYEKMARCEITFMPY